jgi:hypothetical protein
MRKRIRLEHVTTVRFTEEDYAELVVQATALDTDVAVLIRDATREKYLRKEEEQ